LLSSQSGNITGAKIPTRNVKNKIDSEELFGSHSDISVDEPEMMLSDDEKRPDLSMLPSNLAHDLYNCPDWSMLPSDLVTYIMAMLGSDKEKFYMALACKSWYKSFNHPRVWRSKSLNTGEKDLKFITKLGHHVRQDLIF